MFRAVLLILFSLATLSSNVNADNYGVILQYHHVSNNTPTITSVTPEQFSAHLALIEELDIDVIALEEMLKFVSSNENTPQVLSNKIGAITFDDGYSSIYQNAYPLLKKRNIPFTVFVNPKAIDDGHSGQMSWDQLREMEKHGATIANHTQHHHHLLNRLENESKKDWLTRTKNDYQQAQKRLEAELSTPKKWLAYPYGEFDENLKKLLKQDGYLGFSQQSGGVNYTTDFQAIPRFPASGYYARTKTLRTKLLSKPFEILSQPAARLRDIAEPAPNLELTIKGNGVGTHAIQCFYGGSIIPTKVEHKQDKVLITTQMAGKLPLGRSRYNCTAPSEKKGEYYWYSKPFIVTNKQQEWVD